MNNSRYRGTGVALVTPFKSDKSVDYNALERIINRLIEGKVEYLVSLGTTGESSTLSKEEKKEVIRFTVKTVAGRVPIVVGIGGNNTADVIHSIEETDLSGIDAILSVGPYYNRPSQNGIFEHFKQIGEHSPLPIILYNVPGRTGSNITAETTLKLAHHSEKFIATKEASGIMEQCMHILRDRPKDFLVISGDDLLALPFLGIGMDGVISVGAHAAPRTFSDMIRAGLANDFDKARANHYQLMEMITAIFAEGSPVGIKALLSCQGYCENEVRLPLWPVSDALCEKLKNLKLQD